jgi:hypothetical protein
VTAAAPTPVTVSVSPNAEADRVVFTFGEHSFGLTVQDAALLVNHILHSIELLRRPQFAEVTVQ